MGGIIYISMAVLRLIYNDMNTLVIINQVCPPPPVRVRTRRDYEMYTQYMAIYKHAWGHGEDLRGTVWEGYIFCEG